MVLVLHRFYMGGTISGHHPFNMEGSLYAQNVVGV